MASNPILVIACDIGGVIKNQATDEPINDALESIEKMTHDSTNEILFISKCKESYKENSNLWLANHKLSNLKVFYCLEYGEKVKIAETNGVRIMIDDKMQVLRTFPASVIKIWFCSDAKNIEGARRHQPEFLQSVRLAQSWTEVLEIIQEIKNES